ncbi:MAG: trans-aconitate 2-methyltransferase, partial [Paracoccaceae bacterium]
DALFIARLGHRVTGVDQSPTGIADMLGAARSEGLALTGVVADITTWQSAGRYDVILFDRTLHMLAPPARHMAFRNILLCLKPGGYVVVVDEKANMPGIELVLNDSAMIWVEQHRKGGALIVQDTR